MKIHIGGILLAESCAQINNKNTNINRTGILRNAVLASLGLMLFAFGVYLTIQANIGVAPWEAFNIGLSKTTGIKYGTASIAVSAAVLAADIALKEKIGIGMFLDAVLVGKTVDLLNFLDLIKPVEKNIILSLAMMTSGMFIMGFSQFLYMKASLGCGPRDSLLVGLKRRIKKVPIGIISAIILAVVTLFAWLLGGPIGIGTLICAFLEGPIMQLDFKIVRFNPTEITHQNIFDSLKVIFAKKDKS